MATEGWRVDTAARAKAAKLTTPMGASEVRSPSQTSGAEEEPDPTDLG